MKGSDILSPQRMSSRTQSASSSRLKLSALGKCRKRNNVTSALLQQRLAIRVIEDDLDVTPKLLTHPQYGSIEDRQMTAFETIGLTQASSSAQLMFSPSGLSGIRSSSSTVIRSSSLPVGGSSTDDIQVESLLATQISVAVADDQEDKAPSQFFLPCVDPNILYVRPEAVKITLRETETFFIFEMPQLTGDLRTPEGVAVKEENERYEYVTRGPGSNRKLVNAETQTINALTKSRGTYLARKTRKNRGVFVNNWVIHDTYAAPELMVNVNGRLVVRRKESLQKAAESQELQCRLPETVSNAETATPDDQAVHIFRLKEFRDAVQVMERIIASNVFINAQKRFTGLIKEDPCSLDLEFTYTLDLLWAHKCEMSRGRPVSTFRWNPSNRTILAVAYAAQEGAPETKNGLLLIWSAKNPGYPGRSYVFDSPISDIDWSRDRPNLLAVGLYDGSVRVIDASTRDLNVIRQSLRTTTGSSSSPHWQVQWWSGDEQFDYQEQIYTSNQDGRVFRYRCTEDFTSTIIMRIFKLEGDIPGVTRVNQCSLYDVPISRNPGALILRRHPTSSNVYFVGSDEGCVYKCSTNYLTQHIEHFLAHDGPIYAMSFSPFCPRIFLTCGADWCTRVWAEGITEPLITLSTTMACVRYAAWCPTHPTIIVSIVSNEICIWDIRRKIYTPASVTVSASDAPRFVMVDFTANGNQLVVADVQGVVYVYNLEGIPFTPCNQQQVLIESIERALVTRPALLKKLKKLGPPF